MSAMTACYCIGPPGNCPCMRRPRDLAEMVSQFNSWDGGQLPITTYTLPVDAVMHRDPMKAMG